VEPKWKNSSKTSVFVFNVGRGLAVFIRTPSNHGIIYDLGSSDDFKPSDFLKEHILPHLSKFEDKQNEKRALMQRIISHPHLDHISEIEILETPTFDAGLHTCPHDKDKINASECSENINWSRINNPGNQKDKIEIYKSLYAKRNPPLQTPKMPTSVTQEFVESGLYYLRPTKVDKIFPSEDQEYTNGISLVYYYKHAQNTILIPGDINPDAFRVLLNDYPGSEKRYSTNDGSNPDWTEKNSNQPKLGDRLKQGLSILIAPHHGLESGYSEDLYEMIKDNKPDLVVISEKRHTGPNDGSIHSNYQSGNGAKGLKVEIEGKEEIKYSVSTRNNHHILITFSGNSSEPKVFLEKDPKLLLEKM